MPPSSSPNDWRAILGGALGWREAHVDLDAAVEGLTAELRGARAHGFPHSVWELVDHVRITQHDLLDFCRDPHYRELHWPDDYWPRHAAPSSDAEWHDALAAIRRDRDALQALATDPSIEPTAAIPHGSGQTYLRELLLALDHTAYHVGQIVAVRRALGAWPAPA